MEFYSSNYLSGLFGHSVNTFVKYSHKYKLEASLLHSGNRFLFNSFSEKDDHDENHSLNGETVNNVHNSDELQNHKEDSVSDDSSFNLDNPYYNEYAKLQNMNFKNNVAYNRFVEKVHVDEVKSLLYGTWDPEQSEAMWNQINGEECDTNFVFNDTQVVTEEDLLLSKKNLEVLLSTNHLRDFVEYEMNYPSQSETQFSYNVKYVLLFGGASVESQLLESFSGLYQLLNGNNFYNVSNSLYYSEAESFRTNWKLLETLNPPEDRAFHASTVLYTSLEHPILLVCGGFDQTKELHSTELHLLNLNNHPLSWKTFKTSGPLPPKRYGHSLSQVGSQLVLFGGTDGTSLFNDVWTLNVNDGTYLVPGDVSGNFWTKVVYGGYTHQESARNRLYSLSFVDEGKVLWSILPVYVKCPSEYRAFHSMVFVDNKFVISGGEDYKNENTSNVRSIAYSLDNKLFHYIEDVVNMSGHVSWSAFGLVYHWGGLLQEGGKMTLDDSVSMSNPLLYSSSSNIEDLYFKYIQFATLNSMYNDPMGGETDEKEEALQTEQAPMVLDLPEAVDNHGQYGSEPQVNEVTKSDELEANRFKTTEELNNTPQSQPFEPVKPMEHAPTGVTNLEPKPVAMQTQATAPDAFQKGEGFGSVPTFQAQTQPQTFVQSERYSSRPKRSSALKCQALIEEDNLRHKNKEMSEQNNN